MMNSDRMKIQTRLEHKQAELQEHIHVLRGEQEQAEQPHSEEGTPQAFEQMAVDLFTAQKQHSVLANEILLLTEVRFALKRLAEGPMDCAPDVDSLSLKSGWKRCPGPHCASKISNSLNNRCIVMHCNCSMENI